MRITFRRTFLLYILILFACISRIKTKIVYRDENNFELNEKSFVINAVTKSMAYLAEILNAKLSILNKWYQLLHGNGDALSRIRDQYSFESRQFVYPMNSESNEKEEENTIDGQPLELKIHQTQGQDNSLPDTEEELNIHQYHYSHPNYIISNNNINESFSSYNDPIMREKSIHKRFIRRGPPKCQNGKDKKYLFLIFDQFQFSLFI